MFSTSKTFSVVFFFVLFWVFFFTRNLTNTLLFLGIMHKITLELFYTVATFLLQVCDLTLNRLNMVTITELGYKIWIKETVLASQMITNQFFSTSPDYHTIKIGSGWFRLTFHSWKSISKQIKRYLLCAFRSQISAVNDKICVYSVQILNFSFCQERTV